MVEEEVLSGGSSSVGAADAWESVLSPLGLALEESSMPPPDNDTADTHPTRKNRGLFLRGSGRARRSEDPYVVLSSAPIAWSLSAELWGERCNRCFKPASLRCSGCKLFRYCSKGCQKSDWSQHHRVECGALPQAITGNGNGTHILSDLVLISRTWRVLTGQGDTATAYSPPLPSHVLRPNAQQCLDLDASPLPLPVDQDLQQQASALLVPLSVLCAHKKAPLPAPSAPQLLALLRRFQSNNFAICDMLWRPLGSGVYPFGALLQHSCVPNCLLSYVLDQASGVYVQHVRLLCPLEETGGGPLELTHSYVDTMTPLLPRHASLYGHYGFRCACCKSCEALRQHGYPPQIERQGQVAWALAQLQEGREEDMAQVLAILDKEAQAEEKEEGEGLGEVGVGVYKARGVLMSVALEGGKTSEALAHAQAMLPLVTHAYQWQPLHPIVGLHHYTLGDLWAAQGDERQALQCYHSARHVLTATHGPLHDLVYTLEQQIEEITPQHKETT